MKNMPVVYSNQLHDELVEIIENAVSGMQDKNVKARFSDILERMKLAPMWRPGQTYANPASKGTVTASQKSRN